MPTTAMMLNGLMLVSKHSPHAFKRFLNHNLLICINFNIAEEPFYGSGSGSGGGSIEEDGEGSGLGTDFTPGISEPGSSTTNRIDSSVDTSHSGIDTTSKSDIEQKITKTISGGSESNNVNKIDNNSVNNKSSGSDAVGTKSQMSLKRALFTYLLPIYLAWFGGIFSEML